MLTDYVNSKIHRAIEGIDKSEQLQSVIDPELNFRRNSINLYIGLRGSGKTFNVLRELIKLSELPNKGGYDSFIYCTDKTNDSTVNELLPLIKLKTRVVSYADMLPFLMDLLDGKIAYQQTVERGLLKRLTKEGEEDFVHTLDLDKLVSKTPNTVVLYDDALNIFKDPKNKSLVKLLFQNRQPKITYFLCVQDGFSLPPQIKRNADTIIIFGGFRDSQMLSTLLSQLSLSITDELKKIYRSLSKREGLLFDNLPNGTEVRVLRE